MKQLNDSVQALPSGFTYLNHPEICYSVYYATSDNFTGTPIDGYEAPVCITTEAVSKALYAVMDELHRDHPDLTLRIFDTYRPLRAVEHFKRWSATIPNQQLQKKYHPTLSPEEVFSQGFIAFRSEHTRGSALDLTLTHRTTEQDLDMGTIFDFFGEASHTASNMISDKAKKNRILLLQLMEQHGFINYEKEWWHFRLKNEPFPYTYFDFPVR